MLSVPVPSLNGALREIVFGKLWKLFPHINFFQEYTAGGDICES